MPRIPQSLVRPSHRCPERVLLAGLVALMLTVGAPTSWAGVVRWTLGVDEENVPDPFGVGLQVCAQSQNYDVARLKTFWEILTPEMLDQVKVENEIIETHLVVDYWPRPYLNLMGMVGRIDGHTSVAFGEVEPPNDFHHALPDLDVSYDGIMYGGGFTLAGGWNNFTGTVMTIYTEADLDLTDSSMKALSVVPRVGYARSGFAGWFGAMYQSMEEKYKADKVFIDWDMYEFRYDIELVTLDEWSAVVGAAYTWNRRVSALLEGGFGDRQSGMLVLTYRF